MLGLHTCRSWRLRLGLKWCTASDRVLINGRASVPIRRWLRFNSSAEPHQAAKTDAPTPSSSSDRAKLVMTPRTSPQRGGDARLARLVPWIFRNEVANFNDLAALGKQALLVNVESSEGRELGTAVCNLKTGGKNNINIVGRLLTNNVYLPIDQRLFSERIQRALRHRERFFGVDAPYYRLLNAEGDDVPGVVCDRYGDVLCLQITAAGVELLLEQVLLDALETCLSPSAIILRADASMDRELEKSSPRPPVVARGIYSSLHGRPCVLPPEDGFVFEVDLLQESWSSGRFFAERPQRRLLMREMASLGSKGAKSASFPQPKVLSIFGESLGLACVVKGAHLTCVTGLGSVKKAHIDGLCLRNGCAGQVEHMNVESPDPDALGPNITSAFDIVTLEPPALAPTYGRVEEGMKQYTAWIALAATAVRPGGLLLFACRSRTITAVQLMRCVNLGIWSVKRQGKLVHRSSCAPADFPIHMALPDTSELQFIGVRMR